MAGDLGRHTGRIYADQSSLGIMRCMTAANSGTECRVAVIRAPNHPFGDQVIARRTEGGDASGQRLGIESDFDVGVPDATNITKIGPAMRHATERLAV